MSFDNFHPSPVGHGPSELAEGEKVRFHFIDALRGIACLLVLLHHLPNVWWVLQPILRASLPRFFLAVSDFGHCGVEIFFVLSGFVITHSLREFQPTFRFALGFALRRQVRLDPAYWIILLAALAVWAGERLLHSSGIDPLPGSTAVLANFGYLHNILRLPQLVPVSWTLCIEIQFYLAFLFLLALSYGLCTPRYRIPLAAIVGCALGLVFEAFWPASNGAPWFIPFWHYFMAGGLCYWVIAKRLPTSFFLLYIGLECAWLVHRPSNQLATGIATACLIFSVGMMGRLSRWTGGRVLQYLGSRSYSIYLSHWIVLYVIYRADYKLAGKNPTTALVCLCLGAALTFVAGECLYRWVELPSLRWTNVLKRIFARTNASTATVPAPTKKAPLLSAASVELS